MNFSIMLAVPLAALFGALGVAKILAVPAMRDAASHVNMSSGAYRAIGAAEVLGAVGALAGLTIPLVGAAAGTGLTLLLGGAVVAHLRVGDSVVRTLPACALGALAAAYAVAALA